MDIQRLKSFLMWCTVINGALLVFSVVIGIAALDFIYQSHSELFSIPGEAVGTSFYTLLGLFKLLWLFFNLIPYVAVSIISRK